MRLLIINGPNLHNIGEREPNIYGNDNFIDYYNSNLLNISNLELSLLSTHSESEIINFLHNTIGKYDGIILNAGAYTHTSVGIRDAISSINTPVVLVHISNTYARESYRSKNILAPVCKGIITGFGLKSYKIAILSFLE